MDDPVVTPLNAPECWALLREQSLGRLAVSVGDEIDVFPVNYAVDPGPAGPSILFRTAPGTKLLELTIAPRVAFEIDRVGETEAVSVVVKGRAARLQAQQEIDAADTLPLHPLVPTLKYDVVRIVPETVSGRRFRLGPEPDRSMF